MSQPLKKFLKIVLPLGLGVFLIWYIYSSFTPEQLAETRAQFSKANYGFVALSAFLIILSHISRSHRWSFMLEPLRYYPKLANNFMAISVGYLMNIFIPKSGEISRGIILDKYENVPFEKGFGTIISERVIDLIFLLGITSIALLLKFDLLAEYISKSIPKSTIYAAIIGVAVLGIVILLFLKFSKSKTNIKLKTFVMGLKDGMLSIVKMKKKWAFIFHTCLIWILYLLSFFVIARLSYNSIITIVTITMLQSFFP